MDNDLTGFLAILIVAIIVLGLFNIIQSADMAAMKHKLVKIEVAEYSQTTGHWQYKDKYKQMLITKETTNEN